MKFDLLHLLSYLKALQTVYQYMHWLTKCSYADHLLFERLYDGISEELDELAEKILALDLEIDLHDESNLSAEILSEMLPEESDSCDKYLDLAVQFESRLVKMIIPELMSQEQTDGTEDLIQGIANKHEEHLYLVKSYAEKQSKTKEALYIYKLKKIADKLDENNLHKIADDIDFIIAEMLA